jgi:pyruvyl transferase EpsO
VAQAFRDGMVEVRTGDTQLLVDALQWRERRKPLLVLETLLDADDGLHRKAIESFQSIAMERFSKQIKTWIKSPIDGGVPLVTMKETWWVLCANDHLEWHNRDIFRIYKNVYDAQGIQSGVLGQRESSSECISAGYTRIGYTNDFEETDSATFPRKTDMNFQLATAILPPCNQTSLNCFVRVFHEVSLAISTRTIASDSLSHMDPESAAYAEKSKGIIDTEFKVTEYLWRILSQDFFIGRRQAQVVSNTLYNLREEILNENSHGRCVTGFPCQNKGKSHLKKLTKALQGRKHFNLEQPTILSLHDTEEPAMQKRHQCIEAIRERQFSLIGDLIRSSMENLSGNRIEKAVLMFPAYHANVGDHMITLGEIQFLRRLGIDHPTELLQCGETGGNLLPNCAEQDFWLDDKFQAHRKPALFHGGGNWGDIWRFHQNRRISTIQNFVSKNFTFVGMPQSLYYENDKLKKTHAAQIESALSASKTKNEHPMTFLWREQYSFDQASELYPTADNVLFPDIAFQLGPYAPMHPPRLSANTVDILVFMRLDKESVEQSNRHDTSIRFILTSLAGPENAQKISFRIVDWKDQMDIFETDDWLFSELSIQLLSLGHVLICDRLHASILAYISGIPFVYIDQMTGKISKTLGVALNSGLEGCSDGDTSAWAKASDLTEALQMAVNYLDTKSFGGPKQQLLQNGTVIFKPMS